MKVLFVIVILLIVQMQYRLWYGDGSIAQVQAYSQRLDDLKQQVDDKKRRNEALAAEVIDLKKGQDTLEERAREDLGMIKENETFFQVLE